VPQAPSGDECHISVTVRSGPPTGYHHHHIVSSPSDYRLRRPVGTTIITQGAWHSAPGPVGTTINAQLYMQPAPRTTALEGTTPPETTHY
jgi:hypothetical protein